MWERADGPDDWRVCVWVGKEVGGVGGWRPHQILGHICQLVFHSQGRRFVGGLLIRSLASLSGNLVAADKILNGIG